jgi:hypothetical protein
METYGACNWIRESKSWLTAQALDPQQTDSMNHRREPKCDSMQLAHVEALEQNAHDDVLRSAGHGGNLEQEEDALTHNICGDHPEN